ncbi:MAG: ubiquinol cytochrome C oxidoreductase, partial [Saprospiraceae bacterium]|nr:ubiquinol cytochrome C oxidoreductase [Flavobacteriaceae bacterium]NNE26386.1 ubiquinol cytochrome C oxidoreductase [Saprospiraceae bacterium]
MKNFAAVRSRHWLYLVLSLFISFSFIIVWLPLLRCVFDGKSYRWGTQYFGINLASEGLSVDYLALVIFLIIYLLLFASIYWFRQRMFFYILLIWWWLHSFGNLLYDILRFGDTMFHGDTLNIHISLSKIVYPVSTLALILIIIVILKDRKMKEEQLPWHKNNTRLALLILGPVIVQAVLFAIGEPHGITDR